MENLKTISKHNEEYLEGTHSYYMGVTSFADITHEDFLSIYLGIKDPTVLEKFKKKPSVFSLSLTELKSFILGFAEESWTSILQGFYKLFPCICLSPLPLRIDWRDKVKTTQTNFVMNKLYIL